MIGLWLTVLSTLIIIALFMTYQSFTTGLFHVFVMYWEWGQNAVSLCVLVSQKWSSYYLFLW